MSDESFHSIRSIDNKKLRIDLKTKQASANRFIVAHLTQLVMFSLQIKVFLPIAISAIVMDQDYSNC